MADDTINKTKRKLIMLDIATLIGTVVPYERLLTMSSRYQLKPEPIRQLLVAMGYTVAEPPAKPAPKPPAPSATKAEPPVPQEVINTIMSGGIYKLLDDDPDADPSTVFVVTTLDRFRKEREAIRKLLERSLK